MKILVVSQWFPPERVSIPADVARGLTELGHDVTVLTGFPNYPQGKLFDGWRMRPWLDAVESDLALRRVALYPSHDTSAARRAANYLSFAVTSTMLGWRKIRSADVVYVYHTPLTAAIGPWISRKLGGAPYVVHVQDLWPDSVTASGMSGTTSSDRALPLLQRLCSSVYGGAERVIAIAPTMARTLESRGVAPHKLRVIPNWADEDIFRPLPRGEAVSPSRGFRVMYAGNIGAAQGLDVAIRAAAAARDLNGFELVIVGDGVERAALQDLAVACGASNVTFEQPRPTSEMNALTHTAQAQLVSLRDLPIYEGTIPSKVGAIMASGLPIICAVNGDAADIVRRSGGGWTCPAGSVRDLEAQFRAAYSALPEELRRIGAAARSFYESNLSRQQGVRAISSSLCEASAASARTPRRTPARTGPS